MMMFTEADKKKIQSAKQTILDIYTKKIAELGDPILRSYVYQNCVISGGFIAAVILNESYSDIDLYAKDNTGILSIVSHIESTATKLVKETKSYELGAMEGELTPLNTPNAITLKNDLQFIKLAPIDIARKNFDFIACMPYYDIVSDKLNISYAQYQSIADKVLTRNPNFSGVVKPFRLQKYIAKGWRDVQ